MKSLTSRRSILKASILAAFMAPALPVFAQHAGHAVVAQAPAATQVAETSAVMRDLWVGHIFWVRNVVVDNVMCIFRIHICKLFTYATAPHKRQCTCVKCCR